MYKPNKFANPIPLNKVEDYGRNVYLNKEKIDINFSRYILPHEINDPKMKVPKSKFNKNKKRRCYKTY